MTDTRSKNTQLSDAVKYWPLVLALVSIAVAWGSSSTRATASEARISNLETAQQKIVDTQTALLVGQAQMQTDISFIKQQVK